RGRAPSRSRRSRVRARPCDRPTYAAARTRSRDLTARDERLRSAHDLVGAALVHGLDRRLATQPGVAAHHPRLDRRVAHPLPQDSDDRVEVDESSERLRIRLSLAARVATDRLRMTIPDGERDELLPEQVLQVTGEPVVVHLCRGPMAVLDEVAYCAHAAFRA